MYHKNLKTMKIVKNHFEGKTTYIVGKLIINGCQTFTIDKLDAVCQIFKVPEEIKNEVRELYYENGEVENWEKLAKYKNWRIREAVAKQGHCLDILVNDKDYFVREEVARQGYGLDILVNDLDIDVREIAAEKLQDLQNQKQ
jgi:hypothetical protein